MLILVFHNSMVVLIGYVYTKITQLIFRSVQLKAELLFLHASVEL